MTINYKLIGTRIKKSRLSAKRTQEESAEFLNVSVGYISQIERGVTKISLDTLAKLAAFIEVDIVALISGVSVLENGYMLEELNQSIAELSPKERQMVADFALLLKKNR
jgi:transcriptional regulator with XRE-family HTH domain